MTTDIVNFVYLSELIGAPVLDVCTNEGVGRVVDLAATTGQVFPRITGVMTRPKGRREPIYIPWNKLKHFDPPRCIKIDVAPEGTDGNSHAAENEILLRTTFLDKQIISTSGNKLVRVNDLHLLVDNSSRENPNLWLVHIDIGVKGLLRRLGWVKPVNGLFKWITTRDIKDKFVSWKFVQPTEVTNVYGSLHLSIDSSKLAEVHPADLADIIEDLGIDERISLLESLTPTNAAAALQEIPMKIRVQIAEGLDPSRLASFANEMQLDEAVDLLDELTVSYRSAVIAALPSEKAAELKELSKLAVYSVGSIMTTDYVTARPSNTASDLWEILRTESRRTELISYVYIIDEGDHLKGVISLRRLLILEPSTVIGNVMTENVVSVEIDTNIKRVAQTFFKYNFDAVPVVDEERRLQGIVTMRDALEKVFPEMAEESKS